MQNNWAVTYAVWTPEDTEIGETDDKGFVYEACTFRQAMDEIGSRGGYFEADSYPSVNVHWITNSSYHENYRTGETEERSLHIPKQITKASRKRLLRYLGVKGV